MTAESHTENSAKEHMDSIYRYQRYIYDLSRKYYLLGRDRLIKEMNVEDNQTVLEVGCGTGRNTILAAKTYPKAQFYGFDISTAMLETAENSLIRSKIQTPVKFAYGDATQFNGMETFNVPSFDHVFISYALSMIPPWKEALDNSLSCVAPGGKLHVVDFGQQEKLPKWFRAILYWWLKQFSVYPQAELHSELLKVAKKYNAKLEFKSLYGGYTEYAVITR